MFWATIISGIIAAGAAAAGAGVQSRAVRQAGEKQEYAVAKANKQSREDWREQMQIAEEERRKNDLRTSMQQFQETINRSQFYKQQTAALWSGRR
jgi:hypothetical protein